MGNNKLSELATAAAANLQRAATERRRAETKLKEILNICAEEGMSIEELKEDFPEVYHALASLKLKMATEKVKRSAEGFKEDFSPVFEGAKKAINKGRSIWKNLTKS